MMHLAYPNVLGSDPWKFIRYGRYHSLQRDQEAPTTEKYFPARPNGRDIVHVLEAASHFVPEDDATAFPPVYELENGKNRMYRGRSLELAYLLAIIRCHRRLRLESLPCLGDLWCTGEIQKD